MMHFAIGDNAESHQALILTREKARGWGKGVGRQY